MKESNLNPALALKVAGNVETASFFSNSRDGEQTTPATPMLTDFFPPTLDTVTRKTFGSIPWTAVMIRMIPAEGSIEPGILSAGESLQLQSYKFPKRRTEFLSGRISAKLAVSRYIENFFQIRMTMEQIEIGNRKGGRPYIALDPLQPLIEPEISISHSRGYAAAMAAQCRSGIDIQKKEKSLIKVREKYCAPLEYTLLLKIMEDEDELTRLAILWSAKEAVQKTFSQGNGVIGFSRISLQNGKRDDTGFVFSFSLPPDGSQPIPKTIKVTAVAFEDYAIAVSMCGGKTDA